MKDEYIRYISRAAIRRLVLTAAHLLEWVVPRLTGRFRAARALTHSKALQPALTRAGRLRAHAVYLKAVRSCPAYRDFVGANSDSRRGRWELSRLPATSKNEYVKRYGIDERCYGGRIPAGAVIDESAGSTGVPCNWVRGVEDRGYQQRGMLSSLKYRHGLEGSFILNCVALGTWAVGVALSMSAAGLAMLKSVGPDRQRLEDTLVEFGISYRYLVFAYAPFMKSFVNGTRLDLKRYDMSLVVLGEPLSESLRAYLLRHFRIVISAYGATDLDTSIAWETKMTIGLRRMCVDDPELSLALFGREKPPMIFQYDPFEYVVETSAAGELLFTVARLRSAAPKIRYNLHDLGGTLTHAELTERLAARGVEISRLAGQQCALPILYVHGRDDHSVSLCGVDLHPANVEEIIHADAELAEAAHSFCLVSYEDERAEQQVKVWLELAEGRGVKSSQTDTLREAFVEGLKKANPDFVKVLGMLDGGALTVEFYEFGTGPFGERRSVKNLYVRHIARPTLEEARISAA